MSGDQHRQTRKVLTEILTTLTEEGASAVKLVDITQIVVDERVRLKCQIPLCDSFNKKSYVPALYPVSGRFPGCPRAFLQGHSHPGVRTPSGRICKLPVG